MQYRLLGNLGTDDARRCNRDFGATLSVNDPKTFAKGSVIELPKEAVEWLTGPRGKGLSSLLEPANKVRGEAKLPEITAPAEEFKAPVQSMAAKK